MYQLTSTTSIIRLLDDAVIPADERNTDWQAYQTWLADGNEPEPIPTPTLAERQSSAWAAIKAKRDTLTQSGGFYVAGKWFHSDTFSRTQQIGLVVMGTNMPSGIQWKTMDGLFVEMTPTLALQIFAAAAASDQIIYTAAETHRLAMLQSETPETYDYSAGWPDVFTA